MVSHGFNLIHFGLLKKGKFTCIERGMLRAVGLNQAHMEYDPYEVMRNAVGRKGLCALDSYQDWRKHKLVSAP